MRVCPNCRSLYFNGEPFCPKDGAKTTEPEQAPQDAGLIGTSIGNYKITALLGEGGMGKVYRAEHPTLGRAVAIKVLNTEYARRLDSVERFFNEAKAVNKIGHDNIIDVLDFGQLPDSSPYYIMELLEGCTLTQYLAANKPLPLQAACDIMLPVLSALQAAHEEGIIHRDLKPDNIFLAEKKRGGKAIKLLDFGVAKLLDSKSTSYKTRTGAMVGTPFYMSPEQVQGADKELDARADLYSAGLIFYEMITGQAPFTAGSVLELFSKRMTQDPTPPQKLRPELSAAFNALTLRAIAREREGRFQSASAFATALEQAAAQAGFSLIRASSLSLPAVKALPPEEPKTAPNSLQEAKTVTPPIENPLTKTTLNGGTGEFFPKNSPKRLYWAIGVLAVLAVVAVALLIGGTTTTPAQAAVVTSPVIIVTPPPPTQAATQTSQSEPTTQTAEALEPTPDPTPTEDPTTPKTPKTPTKTDPKKKGDKTTNTLDKLLQKGH